MPVVKSSCHGKVRFHVHILEMDEHTHCADPWQIQAVMTACFATHLPCEVLSSLIEIQHKLDKGVTDFTRMDLEGMAESPDF